MPQPGQRNQAMAVVMYIGHTIWNSPAIPLQMFKLQCDRQVAGMLALSMQVFMHGALHAKRAACPWAVACLHHPYIASSFTTATTMGSMPEKAGPRWGKRSILQCSPARATA